MLHFDIAEKNPKAVQDMAKQTNPETLAKRVKIERDAGFEMSACMFAIASIVSRGYWTLVDGHWYRNGL